MTSMKQILNYGTGTIEYDVITSKRVKTSEIIIDENRIVVRTPMNKSLEESKKMIESKASWILKKQLEYKNKEHKVDIIRPTFENNSYLTYLRKEYQTKCMLLCNRVESLNLRIINFMQLKRKHLLI